MLPHLGKGYGLESPGTKRTALTALTGALSRVKSNYDAPWDVSSSSFLAKSDDITGMLGLVSSFADYIVVTNDHNNVPDELFHMSVDAFELDGILRWYFNTEEETPEY